MVISEVILSLITNPGIVMFDSLLLGDALKVALPFCPLKFLKYYFGRCFNSVDQVFEETILYINVTVDCKAINQEGS